MNKPSLTPTVCEQTPVVILAGGKGTRLMPYTTALPKPLMPVGDYPILEILLRQLSNQGFKRITLAVGHLAGLIQAYFGDGRSWGVDLSYAYETAPLGTAGPIARLPREDRSMLVLNGDLLTTLDFTRLLAFHYDNAATATIGTTRRTETVQFGVIETETAGRITHYKEKPNLEYLVSMGIYVFSPEVRDYIPSLQKFDFPDLVQSLLRHDKRVLAYESDAYWMDIGRPDDYQRANEDFPKMHNAFLRSTEGTDVVVDEYNCSQIV
jgi:NDP-sugar pyrophosphorylase family protein